METIKIIIADDHKIVRDGIKAMLDEYDEIRIIGEAASGEEAIVLCREENIDLVIMDLNMGEMGGIEATKRIKNEHEEIEVLALTMMKSKEQIREMIAAGASGYILKNSGVEELVEAIQKIVEGEPYFSNEAVYSIVNPSDKPEKDSDWNVEGSSLTDRELEVLELICREYTNAEIAQKLYISVRTVDAHRRNLLEKTGARNTAGLVRFALKNNVAGN